MPLSLGVVAVAAFALAAAWKLDLLDRAAPWAESLESGLTSVKPRRQVEPPRVRSSRFGAPCKTPAPVYVYAPDETPSAFLVLLANPVSDPSRVADSLAAHHGLRSDKYDASLHGFGVYGADPGVVSRLRCEPAVSSLEESPSVSR
ncbi:MAG: hypothetical protein ACREOF_15800 [Gemmatimonadales bacterium]